MLNEDGYCFIGKKEIIELTIFETKVLSLLLQNKGRITTYEQICDFTYNQKIDEYYKRTIQTKICRLRTKMKNEVNIKNKTRYRLPYRLGGQHDL